LLIVIQSHVDLSRRGAATALNQFSRTIGARLGFRGGRAAAEVHQLGTGSVHLARAASGGVPAGFAVLVVLAARMLAIAIAIFLVARRAEQEMAAT